MVAGKLECHEIKVEMVHLWVNTKGNFPECFKYVFDYLSKKI